jgi:hypothetical protein
MPVTPVALSRSQMDGGYLIGLDTIYAFNLEPQIMGELQKLYGQGVGLFDVITFGGNVIDIASEDYQVFEEGAVLNYILSANVIAVGALNEGIAITVAAIGGEYLLAVGDVVLIPGEYVNSGASTSPAKYQVMTDNSAGVYHLHPMLSTYQITTQVPAATNFMVTGGNYAVGSSGGNAKHVGKFHRHFHTAIKKAAFLVEGSMQSTKRYTDTMKNGQPGVFSEASMIADFLLSSYISDECLVGVVPDAASTVTQVNSAGTARIVRGTEGLWPALEARGMSQTYVGEYGPTDFDDLAEGFESQGVLSKFATFAMGGGLYRGAENASLDWIKEFSGGTDLMKNFGEMGIAFKRFTKNGIDTAMVKLDTFSNPLTYGLAAYDWKNSGFIIPNEYVMVKDVAGGAAVELSNLTLAYKNYNGENRRRVFGLLNGMAGISNAPVVTRFDEVRGEFLSEFALVANKVQQMIMVTKSA